MENEVNYNIFEYVIVATKANEKRMRNVYIRLYLFERMALRNLKKGAYNKMGVIKKGVGLFVMAALLVMPWSQATVEASCSHAMAYGYSDRRVTHRDTHVASEPYYDHIKHAWYHRYFTCTIEDVDYYDYVYCINCGYSYYVYKYSCTEHSACGA